MGNAEILSNDGGAGNTAAGAAAIDGAPSKGERPLIYGPTMGMAMSSLIGLVVGVPAIIASHSTWFITLVSIFLLVGVARLALAIVVDLSGHDFSNPRIAAVSEAGKLVYCGLFGLSAGSVFHVDMPDPLRWIFIINAVGFAVGFAARVADQMKRSITLFALVLAPIVMGCVIGGTWPLLMLAGTSLLMVPGMYSVTQHASGIRANLVRESELNRELATRMEAMAYSDPLTGLSNRAGLLRFLETRASDQGGAIAGTAVYWLDLDRFKQVNDVFGHPVGDRVLAETASRLRRGFDGIDACLARMGGDEFVVACSVTGESEAVHLAEKALTRVNRPFAIDGRKLDVGASMGIRLPGAGPVGAEKLLHAADIALYYAKNEGRGIAKVFRGEMLDELEYKQNVAQDLRTAIGRGEMALAFQPIYSLDTGRILSFEALARWHHPVRGAIPPSVFIPIAEETGFITTLGNWVLREAIRAADAWPEAIRIAVNLSPIQIRTPGTELAILYTLNTTGFDPARLILEVTEGMFVEDTPVVRSFIETLTGHGIHFTIDDFGAGYSSIGYISSYQFSRIKIDRSFISGALAGRRSNAIIRTVVELARQLDMQVVAEGIETEDQQDAMRAMGCYAGQGYFFSRPVGLDEAAALLEQQGRAPAVSGTECATGRTCPKPDKDRLSA